MKFIGFLVGFLLIVSSLYADVTAEIIGKDIDANGNIRIKTQYKIDGVEVPSKYPKHDGKYYWVTRYGIKSFAGMTKLQIVQRVGKDIKSFSRQLIRRKFNSIANPTLSNGPLFDTMVGKTTTDTEAEILVDTDQDGVLDTKWRVKTDGTKIEEPYTPPTS